MNQIETVMMKLLHSKFRSRFHLTSKDKEYILSKGWITIEKHADDFITKRLSYAVIENDGRQTPMRGHPVFIAQHATATCCRHCLLKWHHIPINHVLTTSEKEYIVKVIMTWLKKEMDNI